MAFNNKQYNTRFSGRYNTPGQFVSAGEAEWRQLWPRAPAPGGDSTPRLTPPIARYSSSFGQTPSPIRKPTPQNLQPIPPSTEDVKMETDTLSESVKSTASDDGVVRPHWMKTRLPGVKKVSNKERRRRQNENLRRLLTPKNALMVLNEMMPNEQVTNQFKVEPAANAQYNAYKAPNCHTFCADLTIEGNIYKGYGDNKLMARNAAAEQAIRDLIIKKMSKVVSDSGSTNGGSDTPDEESLPMIQLASFALHKLFAEWEYEGHKVPQLKPTTTTTVLPSEPLQEPAAKKPKELPVTAPAMHPCMLLTYMRPHLEYRELAVEGDRPQNMIFTMAIDVDGATYIGKASNKKEARKLAAKAACNALFKVSFEPPVAVSAAQVN